MNNIERMRLLKEAPKLVAAGLAAGYVHDRRLIERCKAWGLIKAPTSGWENVTQRTIERYGHPPVAQMIREMADGGLPFTVYDFPTNVATRTTVQSAVARLVAAGELKLQRRGVRGAPAQYMQVRQPQKEAA